MAEVDTRTFDPSLWDAAPMAEVAAEAAGKEADSPAEAAAPTTVDRGQLLLAGGIAAALGQVVVDPNSTLPTIGASGAIAGVMGAYFVLYPRSRVLTLIPLIVLMPIVEVPAIVLLGFWFVMQLFNAGTIAMTTSSRGGGVAFAAHVIGFVAGVGGVFVFRKRQLDPWERADYY